MSKFLFFLLLAGACWWWLRRDRPGQGAAAERRQPAVQRMVRCQSCGVYVPEDEALTEGESAFCSREHQQQWHQFGGRG